MRRLRGRKIHGLCRAHRNQFSFSVDNTEQSVEETARVIAAYVNKILA